MDEFYLLDYKGKFTIISDEEDEMCWTAGKITREQAIKDAEWRKESARYYGVPAVITKDKDLLKIYGY